MLAGAGAAGAARSAAGTGLAAVRAGTALTAGASAADQLGRATLGGQRLRGCRRALARRRARSGRRRQRCQRVGERIASGFNDSVQGGRDAAFRATGGKRTAKAANENKAGSAPPPASLGGTPDWARKLRSQQRLRAHAHTTSQAIKRATDREPPPSDLEERER